MSKALGQIARGTLRTLSNEVMAKWQGVPDQAAIEKATVLTDRYTQARKAYDSEQLHVIARKLEAEPLIERQLLGAGLRRMADKLNEVAKEDEGRA